MLVRSKTRAGEVLLRKAVEQCPEDLLIVPEEAQKVRRLSTKEIQSELNEHFDAGLVVDGKLGPKTTAAIKEAEAALKLVVDGEPDITLETALLDLRGLVKDITPAKASDIIVGASSHDFALLKTEYTRRWNSALVSAQATAVVAVAIKNKARYLAVSKITKVPWQVIACIHRMECNASFQRHLHCGDPLTARTVHVPKGRPVKGNPPFTWEESAIDALGYDGATRITDWSIERTLHFLEAFNGWGYRTGAGQATTPARCSPYLWSGTNQYIKGKYVSDGKFDPNAVSKQIGCVAILKGLGYAA